MLAAKQVVHDLFRGRGERKVDLQTDRYGQTHTKTDTQKRGNRQTAKTDINRDEDPLPSPPLPAKEKRPKKLAGGQMGRRKDSRRGDEFIGRPCEMGEMQVVRKQQERARTLSLSLNRTHSCKI